MTPVHLLSVGQLREVALESIINRINIKKDSLKIKMNEVMLEKELICCTAVASEASSSILILKLTLSPFFPCLKELDIVMLAVYCRIYIMGNSVFEHHILQK